MNFSKSGKFSLSGFVNNQDCRIWGSQRQQKVYEAPHNSPPVIIWCALSQTIVVRPYFLENENDWGQIYNEMLP